jgi:cell division protein FtsB
VRKWKLEKEKKNLQAEIYREIHIRDSLKNRIRLLKFDTLEIERIARIKYGLIKEGEVTYVFGKKKAN